MFNSTDFKKDPVAMNIVELFATRTVAEIEANPLLIRKIFDTAPDVNTSGSVAETNEAILLTRGYAPFYCKLKEIKSKIENIVSHPGEMAQVKNLLTFLLSLKRLSSEHRDKKIMFREMIASAIENKKLWANSPEAVDKYNQGACMIDEWVDFFLSYTNRDQPEVNNSFDESLKKSFKRKDWDDSFEDLNMLARLIVKYLRLGGLNIFFDQQSMICGDNIEDKVEKYCTNTFAFAQLIQRQILTDDARKKNWCYHEYKTFKKANTGNEKGIYFFKTYDVPDSYRDVPGIPNDWEDWVKDALGRVNIIIPQKLENNELKQKCSDIAKEILTVRDRIIINYLASVA
jgi:hypothetical protein